MADISDARVPEQRMVVVRKLPSIAVRIPFDPATYVYERKDGSIWAKNEWGIEFPVSPDALFNRVQSVQADPAAATVSSSGIVAPTLSGGGSGDTSELPWQTYTTATTLNAAAGLVSATFQTHRPGWYPRMRTLIRTPSSLTGTRILVGFFSANPDALPGTLHGAWFRYDQTTDTAFWRTSTAAGAAPTTTVTTWPVAVSKNYLLGIDFVPPDPFQRGQNPWSVVFTVAEEQSEDVVAVHTATLPLAAQTLGWGVRVVNMTAGAARSLNWSRTAFAMPS